MLKKSLLSLAVSASLVGLTGCNISSTTDNAGKTPDLQVQQQQALEAYGTYAVFDAVNKRLPFGIDLIFADAPDTDGTANFGATGGNPVYDAVNDLDGISTLAPIDIALSGEIDPDSIVKGTNVMLVKVPSKADVQSGYVFPDKVGEDGTGFNIADEGEPFKALSAANYEALDLTHFGALLGSGNYEAASIAGALGANLTALIALQSSSVNGDYEVSVIGLDGGINNTIRISPTKPLDAKSKYIVIVTNGVTTPDGTGLKPSQDYALAKASTDSEGIPTASALKLADTALIDVSRAINGWEGVAASATAASAAVVLGGGAGFDPATVAISAAFTTTDPSAVLNAMAYPGSWAPSVITSDSVADAILAAGYATADTNTFPSLAAYEGYLDSITGTTGDKKIYSIPVANGALTAPSAALGGATAYEHPRARAVETILAAPNTALRLTPAQVTASFETPLTEDVKIGQVAIELPQYTVKFDATDATTFVDHWSGNTTVGAVLDGALGQTAGTTPPSDKDGAKNVTYRFPFAMEKRKAVVPLLTFEPQAGSSASCTKPGAGWPVVIIQHGFTSDRTGNIINGSKIADQTCHAVIAMDLPHHGIAPTGAGFALNVDYAHTADPSNQTPFAAAIAFAVATATIGDALETTILDDIAERHQGFYGVGGVPTPVAYADDAAERVGDSGSLWIRLDSFQRTRDNMRQAVMDLMNLNASLARIDLDGDGNGTDGDSDGYGDTPDLDVTDVKFIGHSLGAIVGTAFISVNNKAAGAAANPNLNVIQSAVLATPGGHLSKLVENSVGIGPNIIEGLAGNGVDQGSSTFESFMKVLQATVDSADPMNFVSDLTSGAADIPTLIVGMYGDLATGGSTPSDIVVPVSGNGLLVAADTYRLADATTPQPDSARNPLTGLDPFLSLIGAENSTGAVTDNKVVSKYNAGGHSTFSSGGILSTEAPSFDSKPAYDEMLDQTVELLTTDAVAGSKAASVLSADAP